MNELLGNPEETHLDLKAKVDLTAADDKLKFVKDAVTMSQRPPGGYILIGVDDDGKPCMRSAQSPTEADSTAQESEALIRGYIEGEVHVLVQIHEVNGNEIVMVYVQQNRDPTVPFHKDGQYPRDGGKNVTVFAKARFLFAKVPKTSRSGTRTGKTFCRRTP
ncbi:hypothetical protein GS584_04750, partial [Rhodococcus hoagii]|nr:hypothetical protein [Prescottella equi]